jgi:NAD(P)-dependent dehydrogenase (short-subunit alcohol dehydrogenase family)
VAISENLQPETASLTSELRVASTKVNSVDPGYAATDLNQHLGTQSIPEGAAEITSNEARPAPHRDCCVQKTEVCS